MNNSGGAGSFDADGGSCLFRPAADVWILNGAMVMEDMPLSEGDEVMLIERGVVPPRRVGVGDGGSAYARVHAQMKALQLGLLVWAVWDRGGGGACADGRGSASVGGF